MYPLGPRGATRTARRAPRALGWRLAAVALVLAATTACRKKPVAETPEEHGKLSRVALRLEEAYADKLLPPVEEPVSLAERLRAWDGFRECTVRTFVARKNQADRLRAQGLAPPARNASIGEAAVEECAVQAAVAARDPTFCERLAVDFPGPEDSLSLPAARCHDTRARVLGRPDECPVVWFPDDYPGRNPECLALARRDPSVCAFADSPARCRAIFAGKPESCRGVAPDCDAAVAYWGGLVPAGDGPPLVREPPPAGLPPLGAAFHLRFADDRRTALRVSPPVAALGLSWPTGAARAAMIRDTTPFWGAVIPLAAAQISWRTNVPAVKIAFVPGGELRGTRPIQPPGPTQAATVLAVWAAAGEFRRCGPDAASKGAVTFAADDAKPGARLTGTVNAENLRCSDGRTLHVTGEFQALLLDLR